MTKKNKQAFTLIELLVVVLIIGILAAVALPQYQKAVIKSRFIEAMTLGRTLYNAEKVYSLANGKWTADLDKLDVELPVYDSTTKRAYTSNQRKNYCFKGSNPEIYCQIPIENASWLGWWMQYIDYKDYAMCQFVATGSTANTLTNICESMCGKKMWKADWAENMYVCEVTDW